MGRLDNHGASMDRRFNNRYICRCGKELLIHSPHAIKRHEESKIHKEFNITGVKQTGKG